MRVQPAEHRREALEGDRGVAAEVVVGEGGEHLAEELDAPRAELPRLRETAAAAQGVDPVDAIEAIGFPTAAEFRGAIEQAVTVFDCEESFSVMGN